MTTDELALLAAVLAAPDNDLPRKILADYWQEHGQEERAEFVRVQCELAGLPGDPSTPHPLDNLVELERKRHLRRRERELLSWGNADAWFCGTLFKLVNVRHDAVINVHVADMPENSPNAADLTVHRGFIEAVALPLAAFVGGPCRRCGGTGVLVDRRMIQPIETPCYTCRGDRDYRTPGIAPALFASQPVVEVRLTDQEPWPGYGGFEWNEPNDNMITGGPDDCDWVLPKELLDVMALLFPDQLRQERGERWFEFPTRDAALSALSAACCLYARAEAVQLGLVPDGFWGIKKTGRASGETPAGPDRNTPTVSARARHG